MPASPQSSASASPPPCAAPTPLSCAVATSPPAVDRLALLRRFLTAYWLRPENAFWMTLRSLSLSTVEWRGPSIDVSCGDGLFSFLHAGGELDPAFDVFASVGSLDRVTHEHADMFDFAGLQYAPPVTRRPARGIDVGTDLKDAMLAKASALGFYGRLIRHDSNERLPLPDASFETVYCNSAYWVEQIDGFLAELARIAAPSGRVILHVKLDSMRRYTLEPWRAALGENFLRIIGRGRFECWKSLASRLQWERRFQSAGLRIADARAFATPTHSRLWDVGLRPIAPLLTRMAGALTPQTRAAIKRDWVDLFCELLDPMTRVGFDLSETADEPAEMQYVLVGSA
ncbi:MAG: methyltransferase domain-containing protein [Phycisphaerales bacterium]|nr:methyltransferase domain-containing protein [Phycisphaerales bacterium]